jgi:hypothetical protein
MTPSAVGMMRKRKGIEPVKKSAAAKPEATFEEDRAEADNALWRTRYDGLIKKYNRALHETSVVAQLVEEIQATAPTSYKPAPEVKQIRQASTGTPQSALLMLSDSHVGKVVHPEQTLGFGEYNFPIFLARLKYLEESIVSILDNHTTVDTEELVVAMLGDMLDGKLLHGNEAGQVNTVFTQYYNAGHAIAQFLRALAARVKKIRVVTVVGNHTRWDSQRKMPTENRYSNLDMFLYALVEALTKDIPNIEWNLNREPFCLFEVQNFVFHAAHGDHLRGGDKALGIPNHALGREISVTTQLFNKFDRQAPHYYLTGHLHREIKLPHATGAVMVNGGFPGFDHYALAEKFNPVDPTQTFFFVHPKFGKTAEYSLSMKFAEVGKESPYVMPESFPIQ